MKTPISARAVRRMRPMRPRPLALLALTGATVRTPVAPEAHRPVLSRYPLYEPVRGPWWFSGHFSNHR
ncbi:hypothetical protein ACFCWG_38575 [Streptomyces sp. NPDC056390]|uniref:hypothetical protein n=1 Tax=Streptomyces sp. NPDC056390 TaxID=3345806 RepID=UPI0035DEF03D